MDISCKLPLVFHSNLNSGLIGKILLIQFQKQLLSSLYDTLMEEKVRK